MEESSILVPKIDISTEDKSVKSSVKSSVEEEKSMDEKIKKIIPERKMKKWQKFLLGFIGLIVLFVLYNAFSGILIYRKISKLTDNARVLSSAVAEQDLSIIKNELTNTKESLNSLSKTYNLVSWESFLPFTGRYIADGKHVLKAGQAGIDAGEMIISAIEPYGDLLGFTGGSTNQVLAAETGEETAKDRIDFIVQAIPSLLPQIDAVSAKMKIVQEEIDQINPDKYPDQIKDIKIKSKIRTAKDLISQVSNFLVNGKPFLESTQYLLGVDSPRTYLVLFQNDKELRPTGGFMTAYSIMKVENATFTPVVSDDIYTLDAKYRPSIQAPQPIIDYIKGPYALSPKWRLRDMNWSPDFAVAMELVASEAQDVGITKIDGIISVDTQLLVNMLDVIGPIGVSGYGNFSTEIEPKCNCPQVIYELESFADVEGAVVWDPVSGEIVYAPANYNNRKAIIGPLMNSILANALGQPKEKMAPLIQAVFKSVMEKHALFYTFDNTVEKAISDFGLGGTINQNYEGDYLHINDANLGGRKSNLYAYQSVEQNIEVGGDGSVIKTVTITYQNPEKQDGWLNSVLPTWVRIYVPKGSELVAAEGLEKSADPYEDLGKTVFAGYFELRPEGVSKVTFKYKLPFNVSKEYKLLIQKQPGTDGFIYTINLGKHFEEFKLTTDKEIKIEL